MIQTPSPSHYSVVRENILTGEQRVLASFRGFYNTSKAHREQSAMHHAERFLDRVVRAKNGEYKSPYCYESGRYLFFVCKYIQSKINELNSLTKQAA